MAGARGSVNPSPHGKVKGLAIPIFVFNAMNVLARIRQEEKLLNDHFGNKFEAYRCRTKRLLPYLYQHVASCLM